MAERRLGGLRKVLPRIASWLRVPRLAKTSNGVDGSASHKKAIDARIGTGAHVASEPRNSEGPDTPVVDFLIAGMQKGGTTALHAYLKAHPQIFLPTPKELHFFDDESINWEIPDYTRYRSYFNKTPYGSVSGEATPIYTFWPRAMDRIFAYNNRIKLIIMLRNPVERAYSHWVMERQRGHESLSFSDAIRMGRERVEQDAWSRRRFSYVERGFYSQQLQRVFSLFPHEQVVLIEQRDLHDHPQRILDAIAKFLEIDAFKSYPEHRIVRPIAAGEPQQPMDGSDRLYLEALYADDVRALEEICGRQFPTLRRAST